MQQRTRSALFWLAFIFTGGVVAVIMIAMIASGRDSAAVQRVRGRGEAAVARYAGRFPGKQSGAVAGPAETGYTGPLTSMPVPAEDDGPQPGALRAPELFERLVQAVALLEAEAGYNDIQQLEREKHYTEWTDDDVRMLAEFFEAHAGLLDEIRRLAELGEPVFYADLSQGYAAELPHLAQLRAMARLLRSEAALRAHAGDLEGAMEDYRAIVGLGETLVDEPLIISQLVRIAMTSILFEGMGASLAPGQLTPEHARTFIRETSEIYHREALVNALVTEAAFGMDAMQLLRDGTESIPVDFTSSPRLGALLGLVYQTPIGDVMLSADQQNYAEFMERLAQAAELPYYEAMAEIEAIEADVDDLSFLSRFTQILVPALTRVQRAHARNEAVLDLMHMGLSLEAYYAETGQYPESLNAVALDLGGSVPVDPFTGQPYIYIPGGDAYTLYSVGENQQDDGGRHHYREGDIVWRGVEERE